MSYNVTEKLADFIEKVEYSDLAAEVTAAAKASLLDFIGLTIAGFRMLQLNPLLMDTLLQSDGKEVEIILSDNTSFRKKVLLPKGEPENTATTEELEEKFRSCIGAFWSEQKKEIAKVNCSSSLAALTGTAKPLRALSAQLAIR